MKSNKVLLGLFAGILALMGGSVQAQDNTFREIGPANIGGRVSSLVASNLDENHTTIYAGSASGGLYVRSKNADILGRIYSGLADQTAAAALAADSNSWHLVPGTETMPISCMTQLPNGEIFIGTGSDVYPLGTTYSMMSTKGRGIYRYNPETGACTVVPNTDVESTENFTAVRSIDYLYVGNTLYLFAATSTGLYRWVVSGEGDWVASPTPVKLGSADQLLLLRDRHMAYLTVDGRLYKIGDVTVPYASLNPVDITGTNASFGKSVSIKLATAPTNNSYVYAVVVDSTYLTAEIFLTTNGQSWNAIATATTTPFTTNNGATCGDVVVDPANPERLIVGGSSVWVGECFVPGSYYLWTKSSYSEYELNAGDYMASVYNNAVFVHSGINQILPVHCETPTPHFEYYIATNGGVYRSTNNFYTFENINRGMNNVEILGLAVTPDGSLISGAVNNACPFIEARLDHDGGTPSLNWYTLNDEGNVNHDASLIWKGTGGAVAASAFQQLMPQQRRTIYVSTSDGDIARTYADYFDYSNTQTWTTGTAFTTTDMVGGPTIGSISLWESDNDTYLRDSVKVGFDLRGYYFLSNGDTAWINQDGSKKLNKDDVGVFLSRANSNYPFEHKFTQAEVGTGNNRKTVSDSFLVKTPIVARMLACVRTGGIANESVMYSWTASDFTKVYDSLEYASAFVAGGSFEVHRKLNFWAPLYTIERNAPGKNNIYPRCAVMSTNGLCAYIATYDVATHKSSLIRVKGFENVNFNQYPTLVKGELSYGSTSSVMTIDTLKFNNEILFERPISSIAVDPRPGHDRIIVTFEDYSDAFGNVMVIENASTVMNIPATAQKSVDGHAGVPAYCAMVEKTTGDIYVGTSEGVFINNGTSWAAYEHLQGIPVTVMTQQTRALPVRKHLTHTGINENRNLFAKTKWPNAIYFGTYGRGIFVDMTFVTDTENEVCDPHDLSVPTVKGNGFNSVSIFPNPVSTEATLELTAEEAGNAVLRIFDLNGRMVVNRQLGHVNAGMQQFVVSTDGMSAGMYLVNITVGGNTAAAKMIVR